MELINYLKKALQEHGGRSAKNEIKITLDDAKKVIEMQELLQMAWKIVSGDKPYPNPQGFEPILKEKIEKLEK